MVTVLLIDGVGRVREMTLDRLLPEVLVPIPVRFTVMAALSMEPVNIPVARFRLTDELSLPRVYRMETP